MVKRLVMFAIAAFAAFGVCADPVTKSRIGSVHPREGLVVTDVNLDELKHFPYFDGTPNDMRVSPVSGMGGFRFVDVTSEGDEFGMSFQPWGDAMWGFALWDKMGFPASTRSNPYFAIGTDGLRVPTGDSDTWSTTIKWKNVSRALSVSDDVFDLSNANRFRSINSVALQNYMRGKLPYAIGEWASTGTVRSAYGMDSASRGFVFYEDIVTNTINEAATSVVETVTFGEWTSDLTMDEDECELDYVKWDDGIWIVYAKDRNFSGIEIARIKADEDAVSLSHTDEYGTFTCTREKFVKRDNVYGFLTVGTSTNLVQSIASHTLSNAVPSIVTNEVSSGFEGWRFSCDVPEVQSLWDTKPPAIFYVESASAWVIDEIAVPDGWNAFSGSGEGDRDAERVVFLGYLYGSGGVFDIVATRKKITRNALGLATLKDIEGAVTVDKYDTNSVYFIDEEIPTMKLFTSYMRSPYWPNKMSAIEIGDKSQVLKTYYLQVDGNLAVNSPENIRFMSTLDRNSAYGEGKALSLQDYLDAFNPVLVPDTIRMFQTNRSDYSVGNVTAHESLTVAKKDGGVAFKVTPDEANFMDVLKVKPTVGPLLYYPGQTDENGVVTNYYGYAETNANVKLKGNLHVTDSTAISSNLTVWGKLLLSSWENLRLAWKPYENDINNGKDCGYQQTLAEYVGNLVQPLVAATNEYAMGDEVIEVHTCTTNATSPLSRNGRIETVKDNVALLVTKNKATYVWDHDKVRTVLNNQTVGAWVSVSNAQLWVSSPGGIVGHQGKSENPRLDVKVIFDLSAWSYKVNLDVGTWNFVGMGDRVGAKGEWETIYSSVKPTERTETVIHTETYTWYDEYWDDELGEWVVDYDNPITETYEWYDEYTNNMIFEIEPYTCVEFHFKQVGPKAMKVDVQELYKTNPVR